MREDRRRKRHRMSFKEYTKVAVKWLLIYGCISANIPYVLSAFGRDPVTVIGERWLVAVVAVTLGYMLKASFGKYNEEKTRIKDRELDREEFCAVDEFNEDGGIVG